MDGLDLTGKFFFGYFGFSAETLASKKPEDIERVRSITEKLETSPDTPFFPFIVTVKRKIPGDRGYEAEFRDTLGEGAIVFGVEEGSLFRGHKQYTKINLNSIVSPHSCFDGKLLVKPSGIIDMCGELDLPEIDAGLVWELTYRPDGWGHFRLGELDPRYSDPRERVRTIEL